MTGIVASFVRYLEWGSRLAVLHSSPGAQVDPDAPMPRRGWGEVKGPFRGGRRLPLPCLE
ncbi:hypothetical protein ACS5PM_25080 [Ideonella sp. YS5]